MSCPRPVSYLVAALLLIAPTSLAEITFRLGVGPDCAEPNGETSRARTSTDGRFFVIASEASNLVAGDTNGKRDIFVIDRDSGVVSRVSVASNGTQANGDSDRPSITLDGRFVVLESLATNLVAGDSNSSQDIFVHDRQTGSTTRVSLAANGAQANNDSQRGRITDNGRLIAFESAATNLVAGDGNGATDIFVRDTMGQTTVRVSEPAGGGNADARSRRPSLSAGGRWLAFESDATNLVADDTNAATDVFLADLGGGGIERVSLNGAGSQGNGASDRPAVSSDGRYVAFASSAANLVVGDGNGVADIFVRDRSAATTERVSIDSAGNEADDFSVHPRITADGRYVCFASSATNLVAGDQCCRDIFLRDRVAGTTARVSKGFDGQSAIGGSDLPSMTDDGNVILFTSVATNLVPRDDNGLGDGFAHDRNPPIERCQGIDAIGVVFVNGDDGNGTGRRVTIREGAPMTFAVVKPGGLGNGRFVLHLNPGIPTDATLNVLPQSLGTTCFPFLAPTAAPVAVWNNVGRRNQVGSSQYFGAEIEDPERAPVTFLDIPTGDMAHFPACARFTLNGVIFNPNASSPTGASMTNAVLIEVIP